MSTDRTNLLNEFEQRLSKILGKADAHDLIERARSDASASESRPARGASGLTPVQRYTTMALIAEFIELCRWDSEPAV